MSQPIPLSEITPSPLNPRKTFDDAKLRELAASIQSKGLLQPIVVRPYSPNGRKKKSQPKYEIVAGERRWRAMAFTDRTEIDCSVVSLTDREALEIAVVENEQRDDVSPLEKAAGYYELVHAHGVSIEDLAKRIGKSQSTVREMLSVHANLSEKSRKALEAGELAYSVAVLIAKVPWSQRQQVEEYATTDPWGDGIPSYRLVKQMIRKECMVELKGAPFNRKELNLVDGVPACDECPQRVGNLQQHDPDGYAGIRADVCTDPACYREKAKVQGERDLAAAKEQGHTVLSTKQAEKVFVNGHVLYGSEYKDLTDRPWEDRKNRTLGELLEGKVEPADITLGTDDRGNVHRLVKKSKADALLKKVLPAASANGRSAVGLSDSEKADQKKRMEENKIERLVRQAVLDRAGMESLKLFDSVTLNHRGKDCLRLILHDTLHNLWGDVAEEIGHHLFELKRSTRTSEIKQLLTEWIDSPDRACCELFELLVKFLAGRHCFYNYGYGNRDEPVAELLGIDRKKLTAEAKAAVKAEAAAKKKPKGK